MAGQPSERSEIITYIRTRWPKVSRRDAEERGHEALLRALNANHALRGPDLVRETKAALEEIAVEMHWQKKRIVTSNVDPALCENRSAHEAAPRPTRRVGARRPKGVLPYNGWQHGFHLVESRRGSPPSDELQLAAHLLRTRILAAIEAKAALPDVVNELSLKLFRQVFQHDPFESWASVLIEQVALAKLATIAPVEAKRSSLPPSRRTEIIGYDPKDKLKTPRHIPVRAEILSEHGQRMVIGLYGDLEKGSGEQLLAVADGVYNGTPVSYPASERNRALLVLTQTVEILAALPIACIIPDYAFDPELIIWLEMRMGFQGGGGRHSMTKDGLLQLLLQPSELATAIERHGSRMANRADEATGTQLERATAALAARIRARAKLPSCAPVSSPTRPAK